VISTGKRLVSQPTVRDRSMPSSISSRPWASRSTRTAPVPGSSPVRQSSRAAALNLVTAAIILFNCRYLGRILTETRARGAKLDDAIVTRLSPLGWDHINITGDYIWSETLPLDTDGYLPLRSNQA
jgi:hypothetical protein